MVCLSICNRNGSNRRSKKSVFVGPACCLLLLFYEITVTTEGFYDGGTLVYYSIF